MVKMCSDKALNGHKVCEALSLPIRAQILQEFIKAYPSKLTISKLQEIIIEPRMTIWFHVNKLREANLVDLNGSGEGFRAATKALSIRFNGDGIRVKEVR